jgi:phenylpropionate dioxygenase-like ring-hydroxylating dioxygenase large terminal subunit
MQRTLPYAWYVDPEILRREQERIFTSAWQYVGHAAEVAEPGSYLTCEIGLTPVVVTRAQDGELRAFVNVCRHRGFPVARGAGRRETLQCGYHAWTYALDGTLRAAPRADRDPSFEAAQLSLAPARVDRFGPFLFANLALTAPPLADALGPLPDQLAELGLDVGTLSFRHRARFELEANWKIACENFLECYHCPVAHPGFTELVDVSPDAYRLELDGLLSSQFGPLRDGASAAYDAGGAIARSQFHFLWPNTGINVFPGRPNLSIGPINPLGPGRTARFLDYFFAVGEDERWIAELLAFDDQIGAEDRLLCEGVQRGMNAGALDRGVLLAGAEQLVAHFQALTERAVGG